MPKEVSKLIEDQAHDDEYFLREQVHKEEEEKTINDNIFNKQGCQVFEEILEEVPTDFLAQDIV
jgi:hypothetical protein